jgi:tetratricopeptide (TPR) repeat protein
VPPLLPPRPDPGRPFDAEEALRRVTRSVPDLADDLRKSQEVLLAELLALSPRERERALANRRSFRQRGFLVHLREAAISALPRQPALAEGLACLAVQQAEEALPVEEARRHLVAAYCVIATVRRLRRLSLQAEPLLERAAFLIDYPAESAFYLRSLALQRWEQGRPEEAQALLSRVLPLSRRPTLETARAKLLLGLLQVVEGIAVPHPQDLLRSACNSFDSASHTLPALLARLGLALALGQAGDLSAAAEHRHQAQPLFGLLADEPAILPYPTWLDARVAALTEPGEALEPLRAAYRQLLDHGLPWAATLATVDAAFLLARTARPRQVAEFLDEAPLPLALPPVRNLCEALADPSKARRAGGLAALRREAVRLPTLLRRLAILRGIPIEPLPFA